MKCCLTLDKMLFFLLISMLCSAVPASAFHSSVNPSIARHTTAISRGLCSLRPLASWVMQQNSARGGTRRPVVNRVLLTYDFPRVPFEIGINHIHSPEHISETHKLGVPFFNLNRVLPPTLSESKASIKYFCSTLLMKSMYIRMYTSRADQSNLIFFNSQV